VPNNQYAYCAQFSKDGSYNKHFFAPAQNFLNFPSLSSELENYRAIDRYVQ